MPTKKPRLNITLEQRSYDIIKSISETSGQPMSTFLAELVQSAMPTLERMAVTFQKVKAAQDMERATFLAAVDDAQSVIGPAVTAALGQFDLFMDKVDAAADVAVVPALAGALDSAAACPIPRTNRGVTPLREKQPQPNTGKASKAVSKKEVSKKVGVSKEHKPEGCTCTVTAHERQENKTCPVHSRKGKRHAV